MRPHVYLAVAVQEGVAQLWYTTEWVFPHCVDTSKRYMEKYHIPQMMASFNCQYLYFS